MKGCVNPAHNAPLSRVTISNIPGAPAAGGAVAGAVPAAAAASPNPKPAVPAQKRGPLSQVRHSR